MAGLDIHRTRMINCLVGFLALSILCDGFKVGIVGAGPAGASFATRLKQAFGADIQMTVFEALDEIGGQSKTNTSLTGIPLDKGTRYIAQQTPISSKYDEVVKLFEDHGVSMYELPPAAVKDGSGILPAEQLQAFKADAAFQAEYQQLFQVLTSYSGSNPLYQFKPFDLNYTVLTPGLQMLMDITVDGQLYGPYKNISQQSVFTWLEGMTFMGSPIRTLRVRGGWQPAWQKIFEATGAEIRLRSRVTAVQAGTEAGKDKPVIILASGHRFEFDAVIVTTPLDEMETPLGLNEASSNKFAETWVSTQFVCTATSSNTSRLYNLNGLRQGNPVSTITYDGYSASMGKHIWGVSMYDVQGTTEAESRLRAKPWIDAMLLAVNDTYNAADTNFLDNIWELYRYNVRFSKEHLAEDLPARIDTAQGLNNIWYGGGALSHWNVGDILKHSSMMSQRMAGHYGSGWTYVSASEAITENRVRLALAGSKHNGSLSDFAGNYTLSGHGFVNAVEVEPVDNWPAVAARLPEHAVAESMKAPIVAVGRIRKSKITFKSDPTTMVLKSKLRDTDGYYLALHANGVVKFYPYDVAVKELLLLMDSKSQSDAATNAGHAIRYGCFCFGVFSETASGQVTIQRYNRWAEDVDQFYVMTKQKNHKHDELSTSGAAEMVVWGRAFWMVFLLAAATPFC